MERVMAELAYYFATKDKIEIHLVLYGITREVFYPIPDSTIIHKPDFTFKNSFRTIYSLRTIIFLRRTIIRISPSTILSFGEYWNNFVLLSLLGLKYPVFVSDRSQPDKSLGWVHDNLKHILYPGAKGLILQTEKARDIYISRSDHKNIAVIGNPVKQYFSGTLPEKREKIVLMVGRLIKTKHQDKLIEMFARVNLPEWKLIIVGYDHLKQNNLEPLKKLARDLKVEQCVVFTGKLENTEELYLKSSVFAFTSSSEGFPNVIGEAMAAGLAVISFDCVSGPSEMITDGHDGFLIPLFNYEMFQSRLAQTMLDSELRASMGANAIESIKKFSTDKVCEAFYTFITE
jgi:GalNAc-alpha-(1->4)-GalNAc-alpha-(1->3)-diNAcBac-PP-undecaprenol alpha-1,4-N-acetyl-D-galactosaminyltransferase